jgi:hypothetical protein
MLNRVQHDRSEKFQIFFAALLKKQNIVNISRKDEVSSQARGLYHPLLFL